MRDARVAESLGNRWQVFVDHAFKSSDENVDYLMTLPEFKEWCKHNAVRISSPSAPDCYWVHLCERVPKLGAWTCTVSVALTAENTERKAVGFAALRVCAEPDAI